MFLSNGLYLNFKWISFPFRRAKVIALILILFSFVFVDEIEQYWEREKANILIRMFENVMHHYHRDLWSMNITYTLRISSRPIMRLFRGFHKHHID